MPQTHLVVGGGIAGLYAAHLLKRKHPESAVVIVEQAPEVGGLLQSFDYGEQGIFDRGVHTFYETGNADVDDFFLSLLPEDDWKFLTDYKRDLGGSWFEGRVQYDTPYPNLSDLDPARRAELVAGFFENLAPNQAPSEDMDVMSYARARFGDAIAEQVIRPAIEARQHMPAEDIHWLAMNVQGLGRVALLPTEAIEVLAEAPGFAARLAFPDQLNYPEKYLSGKRAYYPAKFGLSRFIGKLETRLKEAGIEILTSAKLGGLELSDGKCTAANITLNDGTSRKLDTASVHWSVGMPALAATLKLDMSQYSFDPPHQTVICNLLMSEKPNCEGTYYAFYHGHDRIHRISFGYNYADDVGPHGQFPMSIELVYPKGADTSNVTAEVEAWLRADGVIGDSSIVTFAKGEVLRGGYPSLSCKNVGAMFAMRNDILQQDIANLTPIGILAKDNLFFQFDIIQHIHELLG